MRLTVGCRLSFLTDLQFLDQTLDGPLGEALRLATLPMTHQAVYDAETRVSRSRGSCVDCRTRCGSSTVACTPTSEKSRIWDKKNSFGDTHLTSIIRLDLLEKS